MALMRQLTWCSVVIYFTIHAKHISGKYNNISDAISRFQMKKIPPLSTQCETGTNAMFDIPTADIHLKLSNEVDRLWDAAVSEQTAKSYKTALDHFLQLLALCNIITFCFLPNLSEDLLIQFVTYCHYALHLIYSYIYPV